MFCEPLSKIRNHSTIRPPIRGSESLQNGRGASSKLIHYRVTLSVKERRAFERIFGADQTESLLRGDDSPRAEAS